MVRPIFFCQWSGLLVTVPEAHIVTRSFQKRFESLEQIVVDLKEMKKRLMLYARCKQRSKKIWELLWEKNCFNLLWLYLLVSTKFNVVKCDYHSGLFSLLDIHTLKFAECLLFSWVLCSFSIIVWSCVCPVVTWQFCFFEKGCLVSVWNH